MALPAEREPPLELQRVHRVIGWRPGLLIDVVQAPDKRIPLFLLAALQVPIIAQIIAQPEFALPGPLLMGLSLAGGTLLLSRTRRVFDWTSRTVTTSVLGFKVREQPFHALSDVFIRSLPSRAELCVAGRDWSVPVLGWNAAPGEEEQAREALQPWAEELAASLSIPLRGAPPPALLRARKFSMALANRNRRPRWEWNPGHRVTTRLNMSLWNVASLIFGAGISLLLIAGQRGSWATLPAVLTVLGPAALLVTITSLFLNETLEFDWATRKLTLKNRVAHRVHDFEEISAIFQRKVPIHSNKGAVIGFEVEIGVKVGDEELAMPSLGSLQGRGNIDGAIRAQELAAALGVPLTEVPPK